MRPEDAIRPLKELSDRKKMADQCDQASASDIGLYHALDTAIAALKKQIPKNPNITLRGTTGWNTESHCPVCKTMVHSGYCSGCGQAIDWEK